MALQGAGHTLLSHPSRWQPVTSRLERAEARGINSLFLIWTPICVFFVCACVRVYECVCVYLCQTAAETLIHSDSRGTVEPDITQDYHYDTDSVCLNHL